MVWQTKKVAESCKQCMIFFSVFSLGYHFSRKKCIFQMKSSPNCISLRFHFCRTSWKKESFGHLLSFLDWLVEKACRTCQTLYFQMYKDLQLNLENVDIREKEKKGKYYAVSTQLLEDRIRNNWNTKLLLKPVLGELLFWFSLYNTY